MSQLSRAKNYLIVFPLLTLFSLGGCDPYTTYPNSTYPSGGYNNSYDRDYSHGYDSDYDRHERKKLEHERKRIEEERRRLEEERERRERDYQASHNPPPVVEKCPPGFWETTRKCSSDERSHGCKDIRMNSGLRCINR